MPKDSQRGFTLIELSITVAIIAIGSAIAMPFYQGYVVRSEVAEGLTLVEGYKPLILEYYNENGTWPAITDLPGTVPGSGTYVSQVTINSGGVIQVTYGTASSHPALNGAVLTLVPYVNGNDILWQCGLANPPPGIVAAGAIPGGTTLLPSQLPAVCRA